MRPINRWVIAILMAVVLLAVFVPLYYVGFFLGTMTPNACSNLPNAAFMWLGVVWAIVLLATALTAPMLIIKRVRWRTVWLSLGIGLLISGCFSLGWFQLLSNLCK